jgi:hypothetical protein
MMTNVEIVTVICTVAATATAVIISIWRMGKPFKDEVKELLNKVFDRLDELGKELNETKLKCGTLDAEHSIFKRHHFQCRHCIHVRSHVPPYPIEEEGAGD